MYSVYIDISNDLEMILFDSDFRVIKMSNSEDPPSRSLHSKLDELIKAEKIQKSEVRYIFNKGPGSYTGLRLLQGFEDILRIEGYQCYNLYSFEILKYLKNSIVWKSSAFKKEVFICDYSKSNFNFKLINEEDDQVKDYISHESFKNDMNVFTQLMKDTISHNEEKPIFYYRSLELEFNKK